MKKRILSLLLAALLLLPLTACGQPAAEPQELEKTQENIIEDVPKNEGKSEKTAESKEEPAVIASNGLMAGASPATSALALYTYGGETVTREFLFEQASVEAVLAILDKVPVTEAAGWTPAEVTVPVYGFEISDTEGWSIHAAWSNGCWITDEGKAYAFDFDFTALEDYNWREHDEFETTSVLPCARILSCTEDGWYPAFLTEAEEPEAPEGVTLTIDSITEEEITVTFQNGGAEHWTFGEYFGLQVQLDGVWYEVPAVPGNWAFADIAYELAAGEYSSQTYNLAMYGDLPAGTYRLYAGGLTAEFTL